MHHPRTILIYIGILSLFFSRGVSANSQEKPYPIKQWVEELSSRDDSNRVYYELVQIFSAKDSAEIFDMLNRLEEYYGSDHFFNTRFLALKQFLTFLKKGISAKDEISKIGQQAITEAIYTGDGYLMFLAHRSYGSIMYVLQDLEQATTYLLKAEEIGNGLPEKYRSYIRIFRELGEIFYHTREYEKSINYTLRGLEGVDSIEVPPVFRVRFVNTIGQAYQKLHKYDSALYYYNQSLQLARQLRKQQWKMVWMGINSSFIGQIMFLKNDYETAKSLLHFDYSVNRNEELNMAGLSMQWLAKINLAQGNKDSALMQVRESLRILNYSESIQFQRVTYLEHAYSTAADVFRAFNNADSSYHYSQLYHSLHDSLEKVAFSTNLNILRLRIQNEKSYQTIASLQESKKIEVQKRNFLIGLVILSGIIALLYVNKLRVRHFHKEQLALQEKNAAESLAREQLQLMTQNLLEKAALVDELQRQVNTRSLAAEKQELVSNISNLAILTEEDWEKFKTLFEQLHPGFFMHLKEKVNDITIAELRMAALTRLHLTTTQISSILGISANSVYKTRQRLRQRLNLDAEENIEEVIAKI